MVDLLSAFPQAVVRPSGTYAIALHQAAGTTLAAIVGPAPGRITWTLPVPREAWFRMRVSAMGGSARIRVGVSDLRVYEPLAARVVIPDAGWVPVDADLSAYAGRKFSLFYRPEHQAWRINVSIDALSTPATIALAGPQVAAPPRDAEEYARRAIHMTHHS